MTKMHTPQGYYEYFCICQMQINDCLKCVLGQICCEFVFNGLKNFHFVIFSTEEKKRPIKLLRNPCSFYS